MVKCNRCILATRKASAYDFTNMYSSVQERNVVSSNCSIQTRGRVSKKTVCEMKCKISPKTFHQSDLYVTCTVNNTAVEEC
jgi:hypothetical protein